MWLVVEDSDDGFDERKEGAPGLEVPNCFGGREATRVMPDGAAEVVSLVDTHSWGFATPQVFISSWS